MLTKTDKISKRSDSELSNLLGRDALTEIQNTSDISYILCDKDKFIFVVCGTMGYYQEIG